LFGPHLIIDAFKCDTVKLADPRAIERVLYDFPAAIGMTRIGGPYIFEYQSPDPAYSGVSGLVVIAESHISIHTFPELDYFAMDLFSCKNFDHEAAIGYIREALGVTDMDRVLLQRGLSFRGPHHGKDGATDELIAATTHRNVLPGITRGSMPPGDPLHPSSEAGGDSWPTYGRTPDLGSLRGNPALTERQRTFEGLAGRSTNDIVNGVGPGLEGAPGLIPIQPAALNPTASISGLFGAMDMLGGEAKRLGRVLDLWEERARGGTPIVLALGPGLIAGGLRDVVGELIRRGLVSGLLMEGDSVVADAYESLGSRHYLAAADPERLTRPSEEWEPARSTLAGMLKPPVGPVSSVALTAQLGEALDTAAPRPGILSMSVRHHTPVIAVGDTGLAELGVETLESSEDGAILRALLTAPDALLLVFGATSRLAEFVTTLEVSATIAAIGSKSFPDATYLCATDPTVALLLLATALTQRIPQRATAPGHDA
jgi:S-adenosylmethionine decarboxylase